MDDQHLDVVLGAGPVGRALVARLADEGRRVRVVTRSGSAEVDEAIEVVAADVADPAAARSACADAATVYGCVGLDYRGWPERWPPMMAGMLAGAESAGARFVFMDNLYMYGPQDRPLREDLPLTQYGRKPRVRAEITAMWQAAHETGRVEVAAVRASDFYGPGVELAALGGRSFGRIVEGKAAQVVGDPDQPHSYTYVPDVARSLVTVAGAPDAFGQAWHVPNAPPRTTREVLAMFADEVGAELKVQAMPKALMRVLGLFDGNVREMIEMLYQWERPYVVDASKYAARFGGEATALEVGIAATAASYR